MHRPQINFAMAALSAIQSMFDETDGNVAASYRQGGGHKTIFTVHKGIHSSKYMPHQSTRECARRIGANPAKSKPVKHEGLAIISVKAESKFAKKREAMLARRAARSGRSIRSNWVMRA